MAEKKRAAPKRGQKHQQGDRRRNADAVGSCGALPKEIGAHDEAVDTELFLDGERHFCGAFALGVLQHPDHLTGDF